MNFEKRGDLKINNFLIFIHIFLYTNLWIYCLNDLSDMILKIHDHNFYYVSKCYISN